MQLAKETRTPTSLRSAFHAPNSSPRFLLLQTLYLRQPSLLFVLFAARRGIPDMTKPCLLLLHLRAYRTRSRLNPFHFHSPRCPSSSSTLVFSRVSFRRSFSPDTFVFWHYSRAEQPGHCFASAAFFAARFLPTPTILFFPAGTAAPRVARYVPLTRERVPPTYVSLFVLLFPLRRSRCVRVTRRFCVPCLSTSPLTLLARGR